MQLASFLQVWFVEGSFVGETFTCGERFLDWIGSHLPHLRHCCMTLLDVAVASGCIMLHHAAPRIVYLQTPQGGGKTEQEARVQATAIRLNYNAAAFPASKTKAICDHDIICKQLCCIRIILISQCIPIYNYFNIYIVWTKRNNTIQPDLVEASLEELKCADCWPWEKYREDGETERSPKPGSWHVLACLGIIRRLQNLPKGTWVVTKSWLAKTLRKSDRGNPHPLYSHLKMMYTM